MPPFIAWLALGIVICVVAGWRLRHGKRQAGSRRASRAAMAAATLAAAEAEARLLSEQQSARAAEEQRALAEHKAQGKVRRDAARAAADRVVQAQAERVQALRAERLAQAERAAREAARRAVLEKNRQAGLPPQGEARAELAARGPDAGEPAADVAPGRAPSASALPLEAPGALAAQDALAASDSPDAHAAPDAPAPQATPAAPVAPPDAPATRELPAKTPAETLILVADDSKVVRLKAGRLLAQHGYRVMYAIDGRDAIAQVEAEMPDLLITDVEMPHLDGFGLVHHLRADARTAGLPIVMITSVDATHREAATRAGVGLVLGKPFPEEPLIAHIRGLRLPAAADDASPRHAAARTEAGALA